MELALINYLALKELMIRAAALGHTPDNVIVELYMVTYVIHINDWELALNYIYTINTVPSKHCMYSSVISQALALLSIAFTYLLLYSKA